MIGSRLSLKSLAGHFVAALGTQWLILEVINFFVTEATIERYRIVILPIFLAVALAWTVLRSLPRRHYSRYSREANVAIEIKVGNLLDAPCNIAIGCSDCFDTQAPGPVDEKSLIAQLVKKYGGVTSALDTLIANSLTSNRLSGVEDQSITLGKRERYPVGTVAVVPEGTRKIFLTVFSKARASDKTTDTTQEDLWVSLSALWKVVRDQGGLEPIAVPVWGSGMARFKAARISLIQIVLLSFVIATREGDVSRKLTLVIREQDYNPEEMDEAIQLINTLDF